MFRPLVKFGNRAWVTIPSGIYIARLFTPQEAGLVPDALGRGVTPSSTKSIKACPEFGEGCFCPRRFGSGATTEVGGKVADSTKDASAKASAKP